MVTLRRSFGVRGPLVREPGTSAENLTAARNQPNGTGLIVGTSGGFMHDVVYLRGLAERYRRLARRFRHKTIRERLECLAEDLEERGRGLQRPSHGMPILPPSHQLH